MVHISMSIEGKGAIEAAEALLSGSDISGTWQPVEATRRENIQAVILHILLSASGEVLSDRIRDWYEKYQQAQAEKRIDKVVIVAKGERIIVENSTFEEIRQLLIT